MVGDMGSYIFMEPTPLPEAPALTDAPGCCYGDGYNANGKCVCATTQSKCEDMGCSFVAMDDRDADDNCGAGLLLHDCSSTRW